MNKRNYTRRRDQAMKIMQELYQDFIKTAEFDILSLKWTPTTIDRRTLTVEKYRRRCNSLNLSPDDVLMLSNAIKTTEVLFIMEHKYQARRAFKEVYDMVRYYGSIYDPHDHAARIVASGIYELA